MSGARRASERSPAQAQDRNCLSKSALAVPFRVLQGPSAEMPDQAGCCGDAVVARVGMPANSEGQDRRCLTTAGTAGYRGD